MTRQVTGERAGIASPRRELIAVLAGGAAGTGAVLLATRQDLATVIVRVPRPLPDTALPVSAQDLRPALAALAVAALASLAAVLATSGVLRRLTGLITAALGTGVAVVASGQITPAAVLAAAGRAGAAPPAGSGAGTAAGSVTAGTGGSGGPASIGGFPAHVVLEGSGWRALAIAGAALIIGSGVAVLVRARRLPVMSGRYDRRPGQQVPATAGPAGPAGRSRLSMWESLSAGADPTAGPD